MNIERHVMDYEVRHPLQARFTEKLKLLVHDLLAASSIGFHIIESRTKDVQSFRDKASRPTKAYINPLEEITDLSGVRIITYYQDEVDEIDRLINNEFGIDRENSLIHQPEVAEFGYASRHYVVQLPAKRAVLTEWSGLENLKAEIQVRTVLQHAWAAVSHKLQYKREEDIPIQLRRKLFRLSALFELADDEFISLRSASGEVVQSIKSQLGAGNQNLPIDIVSLSEILVSSPAIAELEAIAAEVGFSFDTPEDHEDDDDTPSISDLVHLCTLAGIRTVRGFESMVEAAKPWAEKYLSAQFKIADRRGEWYVTTPFVCQLLLIGAEIEKLRPGHLYMLKWNRDIANRVLRIAQTFRTQV